jgi:hypothetical protein
MVISLIYHTVSFWLNRDAMAAPNKPILISPGHGELFSLQQSSSVQMGVFMEVYLKNEINKPFSNAAYRA